MMSASPGLPALAESYEPARAAAPRSIADIPSATPQAEALAKQLKAQGYHFVGPTSVYAFMQNVGIVNDHVQGCFLAAGQRHPPSTGSLPPIRARYRRLRRYFAPLIAESSFRYRYAGAE